MITRFAPQLIGILALALFGLLLAVRALTERAKLAELQQERAELAHATALMANQQLARDADALFVELRENQRAADELAAQLAANTTAAADWRRRYRELLEREPDESCAFAAPGADLRRMLDHAGCANAADPDCSATASAMPDASGH